MSLNILQNSTERVCIDCGLGDRTIKCDTCHTSKGRQHRHTSTAAPTQRRTTAGADTPHGSHGSTSCFETFTFSLTPWMNVSPSTPNTGFLRGNQQHRRRRVRPQKQRELRHRRARAARQARCRSRAARRFLPQHLRRGVGRFSALIEDFRALHSSLSLCWPRTVEAVQTVYPRSSRATARLLFPHAKPRPASLSPPPSLSN